MANVLVSVFNSVALIACILAVAFILWEIIGIEDKNLFEVLFKREKKRKLMSDYRLWRELRRLRRSQDNIELPWEVYNRDGSLYVRSVCVFSFPGIIPKGNRPLIDRVKASLEMQLAIHAAYKEDANHATVKRIEDYLAEQKGK